MTLLGSALIFVLFCQLSTTGHTHRNTGHGKTTVAVKRTVDVKFDETFVPRVGRGFDNGCKCDKPDRYGTFNSSTCKPRSESSFPARVAECKCRACNLKITLHCTCDEYNRPMVWKAAVDICKDGPNTRSQPEKCYDSPPTYAVMNFKRCRRNGYIGETMQARCEFSCRPVQVICKVGGIWHFINESEKCLDNREPTYSATNPDGLSFTIGHGFISRFSCPAGHMVVPAAGENPAKCTGGVISGNFPTCVPSSIQIIEPPPATVTTLSTEKGENTSHQEVNNTPASIMEETVKRDTVILGWVEYILIVVIVIFVAILVGLWSWYVKDKMREARVKRAAVDNRNGHPCIL